MAGSAERARTDPVADWAESGALLLTGHPAGPPIVPSGRAATWARAMSAHIHRATRTSGHSVALDGARLLAERAALTGGGRRGRTSVGGGCRLLPTADGWAAVSCVRDDDPVLLSALMGSRPGPDLWVRLSEWLADHTGAELDERAELLGVAAGSVQPCAPAPPAPGAPRSVEGALVVDFSALWAGPLCAHLLGLAGARVVKVELPNRPDGARAGNRAFYDLLHAGHRSVVLDPTTPAGGAALRHLVARADIVIEASRPRALARLGLDAAGEVERGCTWVSITAHGRDRNRVGFGDDAAAAGGLLAHDRDARPVFCADAVADPLTGLTAAALAMSEPPAGAGALWDVAMTSVASATLPADRTPAPGREALPAQDGWVVETSRGFSSVEPPTARPASGAAAPSGADTADTLRRLGIPVP